MRILHIEPTYEATWASVVLKVDGQALVQDELVPWPTWTKFTDKHAQEIADTAVGLGCEQINVDPDGPPALGLATMLTHMTHLKITAEETASVVPAQSSE